MADVRETIPIAHTLDNSRRPTNQYCNNALSTLIPPSIHPSLYPSTLHFLSILLAFSFFSPSSLFFSHAFYPFLLSNPPSFSHPLYLHQGEPKLHYAVSQNPPPDREDRGWRPVSVSIKRMLWWATLRIIQPVTEGGRGKHYNFQKTGNRRFIFLIFYLIYVCDWSLFFYSPCEVSAEKFYCCVEGAI